MSLLAGLTSTPLLSFEQRMCNVQVDENAAAEALASLRPASRCYVILFSPRSGSSWLTQVLSSTGRLGEPEEYINPDFVLDVGRFLNAKTSGQLLDALLRCRKTENGVFGIETRAMDVDLLDFEAFRSRFGRPTIYFHLWRDNLVAQAVSLYKAVETKRFHSDNAQLVPPPDYNADAILWWLDHVLQIENSNVTLLRRLRVGARMLCYEELVGHRNRAAELFSNALAVPFSPEDRRRTNTKGFVKIADDWNFLSESRFRRERPDLVQRFEGSRLIKKGAGFSPHIPPPMDEPELTDWRAGYDFGAAGWSYLLNPCKPESAAALNWELGWMRGWDDQKYLD